MVTKREFNRIKRENPDSRTWQRTWEEEKLRNELYEAIMDAKKKWITHPYIEHYKKQLEGKERLEKEKLEKEKKEQMAKEEQWEKEKDEREQEISTLEEKKAELSAEIWELIKEKDLGDGSKVYFWENEFSSMQVKFTDTWDVILKWGKEENARELLKYSKYLEKIALKRNRESNEYFISEIEEMVNKLENKIMEQWDDPSTKDYNLRQINELRTKINRLKSHNWKLDWLVDYIAKAFKEHASNYGWIWCNIMVRYYNIPSENALDHHQLRNKLRIMSNSDVFSMIKSDISEKLWKNVELDKWNTLYFDDDVQFYLDYLTEWISNFIKETEENSEVTRLIWNEEAVIEDLRNNHVRIEKKKEIFGKKWTIIHIELPAIWDFKWYKFDWFISKEKVKTSSVKADSEIEEASYSAKEIDGLLHAIFEYKRQYNANKHDNGRSSRFELEKIIWIKLPTPIILSDNVDEAEWQWIYIHWNNKSKSKRLTREAWLWFRNNSEWYLLLKLAK